MELNKTWKQARQVATVAGSAILVIGAASQLFKTKDVRGAFMPVAMLLVGVAAFSYATSPVANAAE